MISQFLVYLKYKRQRTASVGDDAEKFEHNRILKGMQTGATSLENSLAVLQKYRALIWPPNYVPLLCTQEKWKSLSLPVTCTQIFIAIKFKIARMESTQMPPWMNRKINLVYL